ncbi:uncharacterized protein VTP21DRAFT_8829 [Calcarisporiella thermophila]|uniref:uncharacterized protein n=1 Tax=Calcarisporiella thermophila TaxID=911321 RepID=UPI003744B1EB
MLISPAHIVINVLSALGGLLMMMIVVWFRFTQPDIAKTMSFRLSFWIGFVDMLWRTEYILEYSDEITHPLAGQHHWFIRLLAFARVFLRVWGVLLVFCVAFDLHLSFIRQRPATRRLQRFYTPISFLIAFCVNIPWLVERRLDYITKWETIVPGWDRQESYLIMTFGVTIWIVITILYSTVVVVMVLLRVLTESRKLRKVQNVTEDLRMREHQLITSVLRVLLYPVVLIITQPTGVILDWIFITTTDSDSPSLKTLVDIDAVLLGLIGILNLIVFLLNPALHRGLELVPWLNKRWPFKPDPRNIEYYPNTSPNKPPLISNPDDLSGEEQE